VLAASYEARAFGVSAGMPAWRARQLCPDLAFVPGHFREYQRLGNEVMDVLAAFTPVVERVSIDEAFLEWPVPDASSGRRSPSPPPSAGASGRGRAASVGRRGPHQTPGQSGFQVAKPDGLVVVEPDDEAGFLARLLWG